MESLEVRGHVNRGRRVCGFLPGEGKSTPSEYDRAGHIPDFVLDDIADWINKINPSVHEVIVIP